MSRESLNGPSVDRSRVLGQLRGLASHGLGALGGLATAARSLIRNRTETRQLLSNEVYAVPDVWLDDVVRVRLEDLDAVDPDPSADADPSPPQSGGRA